MNLNSAVVVCRVPEEREIEGRIRSTAWIRDLRVSFDAGCVVLHGRCSNFSRFKDAQDTAMRMVGNAVSVRNQIQVDA